MSWLVPHAETECCYVGTTGRRSGHVHEVEIWFGVLDDTLYLISGNGPGADWYRNALATPIVSVRVGDDTRSGSVRAVGEPVERRRAGELMGAKYPWDGDASIGLTFEAWCFDVPMLAIEGWRRFDDGPR